MENVIVDKYTKMIMSAVKAGEKEKAETYKLIKARMMVFMKQKNAPVLDEANEATILNKMIKEHQDSADIYTKCNRPELAEMELAGARIISELVPKAATEEDIREMLTKYVNENGPITQKDMGNVIKWLKTQFTNIDGKLASTVVRSMIV